MARHQWVGPWLNVSWDGDPDSELKDLLITAGRIPGVDVWENQLGVQISWTALELPEVRDLLRETIGSAPLYRLADRHLRPLTRQLYDFQYGGVEFLNQCPRGGILADDMGLGKTTQAIAAANAYAGKNLVIAPLFTRDTWRRELLSCGVCTEDRFVALEGRDPLKPLPDADWYFCHYDIIKQWWERLSRADISCTIIDEAHWCKNSRTQRAKGALLAGAMAKNKRILLTGTPVENRPAELHSLLSIACGKGTWGSYGDFRRRYCGAVHDGFGLHDLEPTNVEELQKRLECCYLRRTAEEVGLQLPPLTRTGQVVKVDEEWLRKATENALQGHDMRTIVAAVLNRQFTEVLPVLTRLRKVTSIAKLPGTIEYVTNLLEQGESVVVFCWERVTAQRIAKVANKVGVWGSAVTGAMKQQDRDSAIEGFKNYGGLLAATMGTLREGVTLTKGRIVIMHDLDWVLSRMIQAERRIYRIGQHQACQSVWMLAENSFDKILVPMLQWKAETNTNVMGTDHLSVVEDLGLERIYEMATVDEQVDRMLELWEAM